MPPPLPLHALSTPSTRPAAAAACSAPFPLLLLLVLLLHVQGYDRLLRCMGGNLVEFLQNLVGGGRGKGWSRVCEGYVARS